MKYSTDDRVVAKTMKTHPKQHAKMAQRMINKVLSHVNDPGLTTSERTKLYKKAEGLERTKQKFLSGKGLDTKRYE